MSMISRELAPLRDLLSRARNFDVETVLKALRLYNKKHPYRMRGYVGIGAMVAFWMSFRSQRRVVGKVFVAAYHALRSRTVRNIFVSAGVLTLLVRLTGLNINKPFTTAFVLNWLMYYYFRVVEQGVAKYKPTFWNVHLVEKARLTQTRFYPVIWAYNRHAQTVICMLMAHLEWLWSSKIKVNREIITGKDGNPQFIDWLHLGSKKKEKSSTETQFGPASPICLLIHGLGDDNDHPYMKRFARMCRRRGWRCVAFSYWRFDFGEIDDLDLVINHIHKKNPKAPMMAIAWSAGGHYLMKYLGVKGKNTPLVAAISVSGCFDFLQAVEDIKREENSSYLKFLSLQVRTCAKLHLKVDKTIKDHAPFNLIRSRASLDEPLQYYDQFIYQLGKWSTMEKGAQKRPYRLQDNTASHYENNAFTNVDGIRVSTLILHAVDDPVVSFKHIDWERVTRNQHVIVLTTKRGGHCAWYESLLPFGSTWSERVSSNFISSVLETHSHTNFLLDVFRRANDEDKKEGLGLKYRDSSLQRIARICSASDLPPLNT